MGRIHVLPPALADRIAAGEVVERPAAVVRELIDNALDAGAGRIDVDLETGGIDLVSVADDGSGMAPEDAALAFARHATSKIQDGADLDAVRTLGFRGEALAAIGAVARVELVTWPRGGDAGSRVVVERGERLEEGPASRAPGTTVAVRGLFAGIPARRKFLKAPGTELEHCLAAAQRAALARFEVGFKLRQKGRELLAAPPAADPGARLADVLGGRWAEGLTPVEHDRGEIVVRAWAGRTDVHRPTRDGVHLFVNRRPVRDPVLMRAVNDAYRDLLPPGRFPVVALYLELPPHEVDVNVHPAKSEVRFRRPSEIRAAILDALAKALGRRASIPYFGGGRWSAPPSADGGPDGSAQGVFAAGWAPGVFAGSGGTAPGEDGLAGLSGADGAALREGEAGGAFDAGAGTGAAAEGTPGAAAAPPRVRALAQYRNCYIVAHDEKGLLVVDQHVAHERMIYERLLAQFDGGPLPRQRLLFPLTLEVGPAAAELVGRRAAELTRIGFSAEPFGPTTVVLREAPSILGRGVGEDEFRAVLARLAEEDRAGAVDLFQHLLATVACHSAVRKGMPLPLEKLDYILRGLDACAAPSHCPHGRVISLRIDLSALDRGFDRVS